MKGFKDFASQKSPDGQHKETPPITSLLSGNLVFKFGYFEAKN